MQLDGPGAQGRWGGGGGGKLRIGMARTGGRLVELLVRMAGAAGMGAVRFFGADGDRFGGALLETQGAMRALTDADAQAVALTFPDDPGLAVDELQDIFRAGGDAGAAAGAFVLIHVNDGLLCHDTNPCALF